MSSSPFLERGSWGRYKVEVIPAPHGLGNVLERTPHLASPIAPRGAQGGQRLAPLPKPEGKGTYAVRFAHSSIRNPSGLLRKECRCDPASCCQGQASADASVALPPLTAAGSPHRNCCEAGRMPGWMNRCMAIYECNPHVPASVVSWT